MRSAALCLSVAVCVAVICLGSLAAQQPAALTRLTHDGIFKQRPAWSPDGRLLVFARHGEDTIFLFVRELESGTERRLTQGKNPEYDAVFAPDGEELALTYDKASPNQGDMDVHRVPVTGDPLTPLATSEGKLSHEESPSWSPDGKWLVYTSTIDGNQEVYVMRRDGTERRRLTTHPGLDVHPVWSPKGDRIALATDRWGDLEIATIDVHGGDVQRVTESLGLDDYPAYSRDGARLAFTSNRDGNLEIYVSGAAGEEPRNVSQHADIDNFPAWAPGGELSFVSAREGGFDIYLLRP